MFSYLDFCLCSIKHMASLLNKCQLCLFRLDYAEKKFKILYFKNKLIIRLSEYYESYIIFKVKDFAFSFHFLNQRNPIQTNITDTFSMFS